MRRLLRLIGPIALAAACAVLISCGGDQEAKGLPPATAEELLNQLDEVEALAQEGSCVSAGDTAEQMQQTLEELPEDVDQELRQVLEDGIARVQSLTEEFETCTGEEAPTETVETETQPTETEEETQTQETQETQETTQTQGTQPQPQPPVTPGGGTGGVGGGGGAGPPGGGGGP
jgi:outer membrane biosynthesis protein TonB